MHKRDLHSGWQFIDFEPGQGDARALSEPGLDTSGWHAIDVPGDVNPALVRDGRMPDPHIGANVRECLWVTAKEWWFRCEFDGAEAPNGPGLDLCLDGVDGHADLFLNGERLATLRNAFHPHRVNVVDKLRQAAPNVLLLRFQAIDAVLGSPREDAIRGWRTRRVLMRKPQFSFGWDWALPMPSIGIMGGVWLEQYAGPRLVDVSVQPHVSGRLDFKFRVNVAARGAGYQIRVRVHGHGTDLQKTVERPGRCYSHTSLRIPDPVLWWPRGMGRQALYDYSVELVVGGAAVEARAGRLGFRKVEIDEAPFTEEAGPGISFWLKLNGRRVFCKGGNWVPLSLWPAELGDEPYRFYLGKCAEANFNMLRVWGGGLYERELFYDLCDELGIMVWQDFMFASAGYPVDRLRSEIVAEADYQIRRLRNRPGIVLWCGCNEDVHSWGYKDERAEADAMLDDTLGQATANAFEVNRLREDPLLYTMLLRGLVSKLGLGVPYMESSPQSYEDTGNQPESGNSHLSCWKYALFECNGKPERFRQHFEKVQSFDSEFCIQGPCSEASLRQFLPEAHRWPPDDVWVTHIQKGHRDLPHHEQTLLIAGGIYGEIDSLQTYVKYGQATHVEMMRAEFESARYDRPNNGGTMMWMFNDCWPTSNWSIIDFFRRPKPAYYAAKRACAPVLPILFERRGVIAFCVSCDAYTPCDVKLRFGQARLDGSLVWAEEEIVVMAGLETQRVHAVKRAEPVIPRGDYLFVETEVDGLPLPAVTYFPDGWRDIPWPTPRITLEPIGQDKTDTGWQTALRVRTDSYARLCHLIVPDGAGAHWLDDNFFDLPAGGQHTVRIWAQNPVEPDAVRVGHWLTEWP
ncbi:MAG: hypothetical protein JXR37_28305 [Kiritimatiellae bacterium]|nr:hypothetical protein [Kiritimatiellia bacterium]